MLQSGALKHELAAMSKKPCVTSSQLTRKVHRRLTLKNKMIEYNDLWAQIFREIQERARRELEMKKDPDFKIVDAAYNRKPVYISPPDERSNATLLRFPKINQGYIILPGMTQQNSEINWKVVFEQKPHVMIDLSDRDNTTLWHIPVQPNETVEFGHYEVKCDWAEHCHAFTRHGLTVIFKRGGGLHKVIMFQFPYWFRYKDVPNNLVEFHNYLNEKKLLDIDCPTREPAELKYTPVTCCPVFMSSSNPGRAGAFVLCDVILRMLDAKLPDKYCIEKWVQSLNSKRSDAIHHWQDITVIYPHLIRMLEFKDESLRTVGIDLCDYVETRRSIIPNARVIEKFLTATRWFPKKKHLKKFIKSQRKAREKDEEEMKEYLEKKREQRDSSSDEEFENYRPPWQRTNWNREPSKREPPKIVFDNLPAIRVLERNIGVEVRTHYPDVVGKLVKVPTRDPRRGYMDKIWSEVDEARMRSNTRAIPRSLSKASLVETPILSSNSIKRAPIILELEDYSDLESTGIIEKFADRTTREILSQLNLVPPPDIEDVADKIVRDIFTELNLFPLNKKALEAFADGTIRDIFSELNLLHPNISARTMPYLKSSVENLVYLSVLEYENHSICINDFEIISIESGNDL